ncbi:MAG TPA: hypothetical protein VG736_05210 [Vicinamibacterales bacterium]|jgi:hypothetical protein|nr:hypothetical protein [Vicinamibacterales bacterium]
MPLLPMLLLLWQTNAPPSNTPAAAVRAYFDLPQYVHALAAPTTDRQAFIVKQRLSDRFRAIFADTLLRDYLGWLESSSLETEDLPILANRIGDVARVSIDTDAASRRMAFVSATADVKQVFSEDVGLYDVGDLFVRFPIGNVTREHVEDQLRREPVPESLSFEVTSTKRYVFKLIESGGGWRITEVWERTVRSDLTIERPH